MDKMVKKKKLISKREIKRVLITALLLIFIILTRYYLGKHIGEDWKFILNVFEFVIAGFGVSLFYFIMNDIFRISVINKGVK